MMPDFRSFKLYVLGAAPLFCLVTIAFAQAPGTEAPATSDRPNIIFMIADDLNDSLGVMDGHPGAKTPELDALAKRGVLFTNAQVNSPICGPSRSSFLTGLYPHTTGYYGFNFVQDHWRNNPKLKKAVTIPEHFRASGYKIFVTGKIYHNSQEQVSLWYEQGIPPSWGPWPWNGTRDQGYEHGQMSPWRNSVPHPGLPKAFGIDGAFASLENVPNVRANPEKSVPGYDGWRLFFRPFKYNDADDRDLMPDELNAQWVAEQLAKDHDRPFIMLVGFNRPHSPMYVPQEFLDLHPIDEIQLAPRLEGDTDDVAEDFKPGTSKLSSGGYGYLKYKQVMGNGGEARLKEWTQAYLGSVSFVDSQVGKIMQALKDSAYAKNTIVIFTSDHGYHMGEKNMLFKNTPWEEAARVPLIVAGPGVTPDVKIDQPVTLVDLYPTLIDQANLPDNPNVKTNRLPLDGHSFKPLLHGNPAGWTGPAVALSSVAHNQKLAMSEPGKVENQHHTVRSSRYRYIRSAGGGEELYDHQNDPHEWHNLAGQDAHAKTLVMMRVEMSKLIGLPGAGAGAGQ
jgi:arylsulfatase A-like enzyme